MGNSQSAQSPRQKHSSSFTPQLDKKLRKNNKLSKPKVGGETPNPLPVSISRRGSRASIQNISLPNPPGRKNSINAETVTYASPPTRSGSVDLGRGSNLTQWNNHPSQKPSRETLNSPTFNGLNVQAGVWLERQRIQLNDLVGSPMTPAKSMSPVHTNPIDSIDNMQPLDLEEPPPRTASSTSSYHSAPQSPMKRFSPSPTKFTNGYQAASDTTEAPEYHQVPVRRRSLLRAAAPGTATRPKIVPHESNDTPDSDEILITPPSQTLALDLAGLRPETPHDLEALGSLRKGSLFVTNGAPSPAPSSPSLRATSGSSQRQRDSSLFSLPPLPALDTSFAAAKLEDAKSPTSPKTPKSENFVIPRKPVPSSVPSSPESAKKPSIRVDMTTIQPRLGVRLVPPSPDKKVPDFGEVVNIQPHSPDMDDESSDEDPHRKHLFRQGNKQFMNGLYQPSPSSEYSEGTTVSAQPSAKPGLSRSPFSYEGAKLLHATNEYATEVEGTERYSIAVEPTKGFMGLDTPTLEEIKPKPLIVRKSLSVKRLDVPAELNTQERRSPEYQRAISATEERLISTTNSMEVPDQNLGQQNGIDSGYSSAGSSVQPIPPPKSWRRSKNRKSAPEQLATSFNQYIVERPVTSGEGLSGPTKTSILTIPYASVRNRTPPALEAPPKTPKTKQEKDLMAAVLGKKAEGEEQGDSEVDASLQLKQKKKRRLSFKRLSFKSEKETTPRKLTEPEALQLGDKVTQNDATKETVSTSSFLTPLDLAVPVKLGETQYQIQPQPERRPSYSGSARSGRQSIGYAIESPELPGSPIDSSPYEPIALTSSMSSRGNQALRSSESVSYTGAAYYQRFATPSPIPIPPKIPMIPKQQHTPERYPSLSRHMTPPSSYRPPNRFSMEEARPTKPDVQVNRKPLGNTAIRSPHSPHSPGYSPYSQPGSARVSRNNSVSSLYSYNAQNGLYQPPPPQHSNVYQKGDPRYTSQPQSPKSPSHDGALPFGTAAPSPIRRRRSSSSGMVGPSGYPHMGTDFSSDSALFGLDFTDVPVRRANDLVQNYGSGNGSYNRKVSSEMTPFELFHATGNGKMMNDEDDIEKYQKKKEKFWNKSSIVGRSKSRSKEIMGY